MGESQAHLRAQLKQSLIVTRGRLTAQGYTPLCPVCLKLIASPPDLHEVFVDRQDIVGINDNEKIIAISSRYNCVNVHSGGKGESCHGKAHTTKGKVACMQYLLVHEGYNPICEWLKDLGVKYPNLVRAGVIDEALRLLDLADSKFRE